VKISVVTVCRNAARTIGATVESFLRQNHADKELIVIDGQSSDETLAVVGAVAGDRVRVFCEPDRGMYDAANKGLTRFTGDAVGFLNADDRFHDDGVLAEVADLLQRADIVFGGVDFVADQAQGAVVRRWRGSRFEKGGFRRGWMPAHPSFYVRRTVAEAVGPFDLGYRIAADYDWMLRACELHGFTTRLIDRTVVDMLVGGASTSGLSAYLRHNLEALDARRRWLGAGMIDAAFVAKPLRKLSQFMVRGGGQAYGETG
jgi:glycosyltransferase involved in cell wall biosynthesis